MRQTNILNQSIALIATQTMTISVIVGPTMGRHRLTDVHLILIESLHTFITMTVSPVVLACRIHANNMGSGCGEEEGE